MQHKAPAPPPPTSGPRYVAIYDYTAADDDEVSFMEGQQYTVRGPMGADFYSDVEYWPQIIFQSSSLCLCVQGMS